MSNSTRTLQAVVNMSAAHTELMPLAGVGGYTNEPALSLCNQVMQELLASPMAWKWNRHEMAFLVTALNKQDYLHAGATAWTVNGGVGIALKTASTPGITTTGFPGTVTVTTLEPHNFNAGDTVYLHGNVDSVYDSAFSQTSSSSSWTGGYAILATPTTTSFTFASIAGQTLTSGAPGITNLNWLESGTMVEVNSATSPQITHPILAVRTLQPCSTVDKPTRVSIVSDDGAGTLKIRFNYACGSTPFGVNLVYQGKPILAADLTGTWAPIPDSLSYVVDQLFLARAYRFVNSGRADIEFQRAQVEINRAQMNEDSEESEEYVTPVTSLMGGGTGWY